MHKSLPRTIAIAVCSLALAGVLGAVSSQPSQQARTNLGVLDSSGPILFFIDDGKGVPGYQSADPELARFALEGWSRESGGKVRFMETKDRDRAIVQVRWVSAYEGLFGETERTVVGGKAGAIVRVMPDIKQLGDALFSRSANDQLFRDTIVYLTCVHELGHALGLPHTNNFQDIMYYFGYGGDFVDYFQRYRVRLRSREDIAKYSGLSPADAKFLNSLYPK